MLDENAGSPDEREIAKATAYRALAELIYRDYKRAKLKTAAQDTPLSCRHTDKNPGEREDTAI